MGSLFRLHGAPTAHYEEDVAELGVRVRTDKPPAGTRAVVQMLNVHELFGHRSMRIAVQIKDRYSPGSRHKLKPGLPRLNCPSNQSSLASDFVSRAYGALVEVARGCRVEAWYAHANRYYRRGTGGDVSGVAAALVGHRVRCRREARSQIRARPGARRCSRAEHDRAHALPWRW